MSLHCCSRWVSVPSGQAYSNGWRELTSSVTVFQSQFYTRVKQTNMRCKVNDTLIHGYWHSCSVKMAENWSSSFFLLKLEPEGGLIKTSTKKQGQHPAIMTEQVWSMKDLLGGGTRWVLPSERDGLFTKGKVKMTGYHPRSFLRVHVPRAIDQGP